MLHPFTTQHFVDLGSDDIYLIYISAVLMDGKKIPVSG